jgi:hypothetical protein
MTMIYLTLHFCPNSNELYIKETDTDLGVLEDLLIIK